MLCLHFDTSMGDARAASRELSNLQVVYLNLDDKNLSYY